MQNDIGCDRLFEARCAHAERVLARGKLREQKFAGPVRGSGKLQMRRLVREDCDGVAYDSPTGSVTIPLISAVFICAEADVMDDVTRFA